MGRGVQHEVSRGVEESHGAPVLQAAIPETAVRLFHGWPHTGHELVEHGRL
jgi:hypothetical protein